MTALFEIPRLRTLARHAAPHVLEGTVAPLALFLLTLHFVGVWGAVLIGLGWTYAAVARRLITGRPVPGILVLGAVTLLWAVTQLANASVTLWLLLSESLATFLVAKTLVSWGLTGSAIVVSTIWFKRSMTRHGILARRAAHAPASVL